LGLQDVVRQRIASRNSIPIPLLGLGGSAGRKRGKNAGQGTSIAGLCNIVGVAFKDAEERKGFEKEKLRSSQISESCGLEASHREQPH